MKELSQLEAAYDAVGLNGSLKNIQSLGKKLSMYHSSTLHNYYSSWAALSEKNTSQGIVITPGYIAKNIIENALQESNISHSNLSWCDPCCGSGVFLEELLQAYIERGVNQLSDLPSISAFEISPQGLASTYAVVANLLSSIDVDIDEYISSGKLELVLDDFLNYSKEQPTLMDPRARKFDCVVGNPPYVRASRLSEGYRNSIRSSFPKSYNGFADLYCYFLIGAINCLNKEGIVGFISPANFFRTKSALKLRNQIDEHCRLLKVIDLDEHNIFTNADVHTAIYWLKKTISKRRTFKYSHIRSSEELKSLKNGSVRWEQYPLSGIKPLGWRFVKSGNDFLTQNTAQTVALKDLGMKVYSGIRPSIKKAFVYDLDELAQNLDSTIINDWFRPAIDAKSILKWRSESKNLRLLFIQPSDNQVPRTLIEFLQSQQEKIKNTYDNKSGLNWYALRSCSYYHVFESPYIAYPDICTNSRFSLVDDKRVPLDGAFAIDTTDLGILGILNSRVGWEYFYQTCASIGNASNKGRVRLKKNYVENFPLPYLLTNPEYDGEKLDSLVRRALCGEDVNDQIDDEVLKMYRSE